MLDALTDDRLVLIGPRPPWCVENAAVRGGERGPAFNWSRSNIAVPNGTCPPKIGVGFGERGQQVSTNLDGRELTCRMVDHNAPAEVPDLSCPRF